MRAGNLGDVFGSAGRDDGAAALAAIGSEVDHPVGGLDHVEIVLDDHQAAAVLDQALEGREQLRDVVEVEAGGGLVEDEQRACDARRATGKPRA